MSEPQQYIVDVDWDSDAGVWVATSDDVPGLVSEAASLDVLIERVRAVVPELLADNAHLVAAGEEGREAVLDLRVHQSFQRPAAHAL